MDDINWADKIADWAWAVMLALGAVIGGAIMRISKHEARIMALESNHKEHIAQVAQVSSKIDDSSAEINRRIEAMRDELRADHRMVVTELLKRVPTT